MTTQQLGRLIGLAILVVTVLAAIFGIQIDVPVVDPAFPIK